MYVSYGDGWWIEGFRRMFQGSRVICNFDEPEIHFQRTIFASLAECGKISPLRHNVFVDVAFSRSGCALHSG